MFGFFLKVRYKKVSTLLNDVSVASLTTHSFFLALYSTTSLHTDEKAARVGARLSVSVLFCSLCGSSLPDAASRFSTKKLSAASSCEGVSI